MLYQNSTNEEVKRKLLQATTSLSLIFLFYESFRLPARPYFFFDKKSKQKNQPLLKNA